MRHNNIRDLEAALLRPICRDVKIEPKLMPLGCTGTQSTNIADGARPDVSAVGLWSPMERTFLDVCVIHVNSPSYEGSTPAQLYERNENRNNVYTTTESCTSREALFHPLFSQLLVEWDPNARGIIKGLQNSLRRKEGILMLM